jgi:hypothetical protein
MDSDNILRALDRLRLRGDIMKRRQLLAASLALAPLTLIARRAYAHHGWNSFDEARPIYIEGIVKSVRWQNPHAELVVTMSADAKVPADLATRKMPAQSSRVDAQKILATTVTPTRRGDWTLELSPMTRIQAWKIPQPKVGDTVAAIGYTFKDEKGAAFSRVEYLLVGGQAYGLRSNPA